VLVNNAGLGRFGEVDALDPDDWDLQVNTNLTGLYRCTAATVPHMKRLHAETGRVAHIVNVASIAGLVGNPRLSAYNATKFGVRGFSEATMKELRPHGIKVSCVYPGSVDTDFGSGAGTAPNPNAMDAEDIAATVLHLIQTPPGYLISEVVMRPMQTRG
jgi:short-subunit dehydrogenase